MYVCMYKFMYECVWLCVCMYVCMCVCVYVNVRMHTEKGDSVAAGDVAGMASLLTNGLRALTYNSSA